MRQTDIPEVPRLVGITGYGLLAGSVSESEAIVAAVFVKPGVYAFAVVF